MFNIASTTVGRAPTLIPKPNLVQLLSIRSCSAFIRIKFWRGTGNGLGGLVWRLDRWADRSATCSPQSETGTPWCRLRPGPSIRLCLRASPCPFCKRKQIVLECLASTSGSLYCSHLCAGRAPRRQERRAAQMRHIARFCAVPACCWILANYGPPVTTAYGQDADGTWTGIRQSWNGSQWVTVRGSGLSSSGNLPLLRRDTL